MQSGYHHHLYLTLEMQLILQNIATDNNQPITHQTYAIASCMKNDTIIARKRQFASVPNNQQFAKTGVSGTLQSRLFQSYI